MKKLKQLFKNLKYLFNTDLEVTCKFEISGAKLDGILRDIKYRNEIKNKLPKDKYAEVRNVNGNQLLYLDDVLIPNVVKTRVTQDVEIDGNCFVKVWLYAKIKE